MLKSANNRLIIASLKTIIINKSHVQHMLNLTVAPRNVAFCQII